MRRNCYLESNEDDDEDEIEKPPEEQIPQKEDPIWPRVRLYFKLGGYFKWSWKEFEETPWPVQKQLAMLLDEKEADMDQFLSYEEAAIFKNLRRMFPPTEKTE